MRASAQYYSSISSTSATHSLIRKLRSRCSTTNGRQEMGRTPSFPSPGRWMPGLEYFFMRPARISNGRTRAGSGMEASSLLPQGNLQRQTREHMSRGRRDKIKSALCVHILERPEIRNLWNLCKYDQSFYRSRYFLISLLSIEIVRYILGLSPRRRVGSGQGCHVGRRRSGGVTGGGRR